MLRWAVAIARPTDARRAERPRDYGRDPESAERWLGYLRATLCRYFRMESVGAEQLPPGRALIVGCHSGVIPYDAACALVAIHEGTGRLAYAIGDRIFGRLAPVERFLRRQGAIVGSPDVVESLLADGELVLLMPGGALDMTRPYPTQRYRVLPHRGWAPGHGGYVKAALRTGVPIVPVAVVGAEETHVMLGDVRPLAKLLGVPLVPLLLFPLPLPVKVYVRFGRPIRLRGTRADADDQRVVDRLNAMVQRRLQRLIDDTVARRHGVIVSRFDSEPVRRHRDA